MADENSIGSASTSELVAESSESTFEINVKTLDSQIYSFRVQKNMSVPSLKEKVASAIGVPVEQQRLIFRGKVLKDNHSLSEYHVEDGHTLHLVVRPPVQPQIPGGTSSGESNETTDNRGNGASAAAPRNRAGVSHSVLLGSFNVGDQGGEGSGPDISRIIGAVINSLGIGNLTSGANNQQGIPSNVSNQASQGVETGGTSGNIGDRSESGNQMPHPLQSLPGTLPFPFRGAAVAVPSLQMHIPDALRTISEFINRMELALSATGYWPTSSSTNAGDSQTADLPSNVGARRTPEALSVVLRRAQQLLSGHTVAALSHIAGRLEGEGGSIDPAVRNQIQTESVQVGLAMQHLGSLFLELGRTILTLYMGMSPAESLVNAGPAVYISPSGPNPIMVQPFPLQTSPLFGSPTSSQGNSGIMGPVGPADASRSVNIHIHAGPARVVPLRNGIGASVPPVSRAEAQYRAYLRHPPEVRNPQNNQSQPAPAQSPIAGTSSIMQPSVGDSVPQSSSESVSIPTLVAEFSTRFRDHFFMSGESQFPPGQSEDSTNLGLSSETRIDDSVGNHGQENMAANGAEEKVNLLKDCSSESAEQQKPVSGGHINEGEVSLQKPVSGGHINIGEVSGSWSSTETSSTSISESPAGPSSRETPLPCKSEDIFGVAPESSLSNDPHGVGKAVPLGLGLGGLQPKQRRSRPAKSEGKNVTGTSGVGPENGSGQHVLQSHVSHVPSGNTGGPLGQLHNTIGAPDSNGQLNVASMMSQVLNSPALNGLLAGVSEQAGIGSPDGLRNMMEQLTQSPSMRNTLNQVIQQIDGQDRSNNLGITRGQGGGIDLSRMFQQMMPIVSQALMGTRSTPEPPFDLSSTEQRQNDLSAPVRVDQPNQNSQIDLQQVAQRIEQNDAPINIFRSVLEHAADLSPQVDIQDLVDDLCRDEDLANEYMEMLHRDMH